MRMMLLVSILYTLGGITTAGASDARTRDSLKGIPACSDPAVISELKNAVKESPKGRTYGWRLLAVQNVNDITVGFAQKWGFVQPYTRICTADAYFNGGEMPTFHYTISVIEGQIMLQTDHF